MTGPSPRSRLLTTRALLANVDTDLLYILAREDGPGIKCAIAQRADFLIGELEHAVARLREAKKQSADWKKFV